MIAACWKYSSDCGQLPGIPWHLNVLAGNVVCWCRDVMKMMMMMITVIIKMIIAAMPTVFYWCWQVHWGVVMSKHSTTDRVVCWFNDSDDDDGAAAADDSENDDRGDDVSKAESILQTVKIFLRVTVSTAGVRIVMMMMLIMVKRMMMSAKLKVFYRPQPTYLMLVMLKYLCRWSFHLLWL